MSFFGVIILDNGSVFCDIPAILGWDFIWDGIDWE